MSRSIEREFAKLRENHQLECKSAEGGLPGSFWETYSAFANGQGGRILLGVKEGDGKFRYGQLDISQLDALRRSLFNHLNNRQKISHRLIDDTHVICHEQLGILEVRIPKADYKQRPVHIGLDPYTGTFIRHHEGDYKASRAEVRRMMIDAELDTPHDSEILKGCTLEHDLDPKSVDTYRRLDRDAHPMGHPFAQMSDEEFLLKRCALRRDRSDGKVYVTRAGLLMLGRYECIKEYYPSFFLDYQDRGQEGTRWTQRIYSDGVRASNLLHFYLDVLAELNNKLPIPFTIQEGLRREHSPEHEAVREALANTLVHADYSAQDHWPLIISTPQQLQFINAGDLLIPIEKYYAGGGPSVCRNRTLQDLFVSAGIAERAGSGVDKIMQGWQHKLNKPKLSLYTHPARVELSLPLAELFPKEVYTKLEEQFGRAWKQDLPDNAIQILCYAVSNSPFSNKDAQGWLQVHSADISILLRKLTTRGLLVGRGHGRGRTYQIASSKYSAMDTQHQRLSYGLPTHGHSNENVTESSVKHINEHVNPLHQPKGINTTHYTSIEKEHSTDTQVELVNKLVSRLSEDMPEAIANVVLQLCQSPKSIQELIVALDYDKSRIHFSKTILYPLIQTGQLALVYPDSPRHPRQKYYATKTNK